MINKRQNDPDTDVNETPNVIIRFHDEVELPYIDHLELYLLEKNLAPWEDLVSRFPGISIKRVYISLSPGDVQELENSAFKDAQPWERPNFLKFFQMESPADTDRYALAEALSEWGIVKLAYVPFALAFSPNLPSRSAGMQGFQEHLFNSPTGIGAQQAWLTPNADGSGMQFIDLERGWGLGHSNFMANPADAQSPSVFSVADPPWSYLSNIDELVAHGSSVLGTVAAPDNGGNIIGIAFRASGRVISINRLPAEQTEENQGQVQPLENIHDAILKATSLLTEGDVLLIEAQANDAAQQLWPVETNLLEFEEILAATRRGIVVVEPAGNGNPNNPIGADGNDLDLFSEPTTGHHILDRNNLNEFRDSGAIVVGSAAWSPHARMQRTSMNQASNFGSRVDCYAWGEWIVTTGGPDPSDYDPQFGSTSGASAIIAGAALIVQGLAKANQLGDHLNHTFSPGKLRGILQEPAFSTPSDDPARDRTGRMPDLVKIIDDCLQLGPALSVRDSLENPESPTGSTNSSPDIIVRNARVRNFELEFGQGSSKQNMGGLSERIIKDGNDKFVYVRVTNRGSTPAENVEVTVYWSQHATLLTPALWNKIGSNRILSIPAGEMRACEILWHDRPEKPIPPSGDYALLALAGNERDPVPSQASLSSFTSWQDYEGFIRNSPHVACLNFSQTAMPLASRTAAAEDRALETGPAPQSMMLSFLATGAQFEDMTMQFEIDAQLPNGAGLELEGPAALLSAFGEERVFPPKDTEDESVRRMNVRLNEPDRSNEILFSKNLRARMNLFLKIPRIARGQSYKILLRQLHNDEEIGRITWQIVPRKRRRKLG